MTGAEAVQVTIAGGDAVSGLVMRPADAKTCLVLAHGAGAGMTHDFMADIAAGLAARSIATLRFQFPYMEKGSKRPDRPSVAHATVRAAVACADHLMPDLPLFAAGKSFGGRMTSQAQANEPLPNVRGLLFLGFPLHPAAKPSTERAEHLSRITVPMLFLQGDRDALADINLLKPIVAARANADMIIFGGANHAFAVPKRFRQEISTLDRLSGAIRSWTDRILA